MSKQFKRKLADFVSEAEEPGRVARTDDTRAASTESAPAPQAAVSPEGPESWKVLLGRLPRLVRVGILEMLSPDEIERELCQLDPTFAYLYCGEPIDGNGVGDDRDVVWEHWLYFLERDFGISRNPDRCRGYSDFERKMIVKDLDKHIPTENRLNAFLAHSYKTLYKQLDQLNLGTWQGLQTYKVQAIQDHTVFYKNPLGQKQRWNVCRRWSLYLHWKHKPNRPAVFFLKIWAQAISGRSRSSQRGRTAAFILLHSQTFQRILYTFTAMGFAYPKPSRTRFTKTSTFS